MVWYSVTENLPTIYRNWELKRYYLCNGDPLLLEVNYQVLEEVKKSHGLFH